MSELAIRSEVDRDLREQSLAALGEILRREHELALRAGFEMIVHSVRAGDVLLEVRSRVQAGEWEGWLESNFPQTPRHAQKLMRLARHAEKVLSHQPKTMGEALALVADPKRSRGELNLAREEAKHLRREGRTWKEIGTELGVDPKTAYYYVEETAYRAHLKQLAQKRRQLLKVGKREIAHREKAKIAKAAGGGIAEAYSLVRKALEALQEETSQTSEPDAKRAIKTAMNNLYAAEDAVIRAGKLPRVNRENGRVA